MEIKGFILWNKDLRRVGYVYKTRTSAEIGRFKNRFMAATNCVDMGKPMTTDLVEELVEHAMKDFEKDVIEIREVTVIIKETE